MVNSPATILIVDDEPSVRAAFRAALQSAGHSVVESAHGREALKELERQPIHLVLLDVDMPEMDGWATLAELRRRGLGQPVLMITHDNTVPSRIRGLDTGADDYLGKPCGAPELLARVRALLRRAPPLARASSILQFGDLTVDLANMTAERAGQTVQLSRTDYAVLSLLHASGGKAVLRDQLLQEIWANASGSSHALDTHIWRLRRKLGDDPKTPRWLVNVPGIGYTLRPGA